MAKDIGTIAVQHACSCDPVDYYRIAGRTPPKARLEHLAELECSNCAARWHASVADAYSAEYQVYLDYGTPINFDLL